MEIFTIAAWEIWKQRNALIFRRIASTFHSWKDCFIDTAKLQVYRLNDSLRDSLTEWLNSLL
uniref:Uncharacterized protein n=1 Tax=Arundo donax TaxID=35708 RepID=A0A0A8ZCW2_ARUDO